MLCIDNLFDYEVPEIIEVIESIPLTGIGKIDYRKLEEANFVGKYENFNRDAIIIHDNEVQLFKVE